MTVQFSFVATPDLGQKALRFLLWRRAGPLGPIAVVVLPILLAILAADPAWRPAAYVLGGAAIMLFVIFLVGVAHLRRLRRRFFERATDHTVSVSMDESGVSVVTVLGSSTLPWRSFERLWTGESVVLLFYHGWQRLVFPREAVSQEALDFMSSMLEANKRAAVAS
jgi:hypothetical protein